MPKKAAQALMNGQERIDPATAAALLTITAEDLHRPRLPAGGTRLRLRSLMAMGHGDTRLARAAGTSPADVRKIIHGGAAEVTPELHDRVRGVWEAWWDKTPPVRTAAEAAAATKARVRARRRGWCTPLGLDEDLIDRVGYQPGHSWLPATGTGTPPDQEPSRPGQNRLAAQHNASHTEEGNTMPFDPVPRQASEYQKGAAFGHATVMLANRRRRARRPDPGNPGRRQANPARRGPHRRRAGVLRRLHHRRRRPARHPASRAARRTRRRTAGTRRRARARTGSWLNHGT